MPKIVDHAARRREIAAGAVPVFAREGYHAANLSKIASLCGVGRTTIYKYFKDKDEIFLFVLDEVFGRLEGEAAKLVAESPMDAASKLAALTELLVQESLAEHDRILIVLDLLLRLRREQALFATGIRKRIGGIKALLEGVIRSGIREGELRPTDPSALAFALVSLAESFILQHSFNEGFSYDEAMGATRVLIEGLRVRPAPDPIGSPRRGSEAQSRS